MLLGGICAANDAKVEALAYDFFQQAFLLYEEGLGDQRSRIAGLHALVAALGRTGIFSEENRATLCHQVTGYAGLMLRKVDQATAALVCSHMYWCDPEDGTSAVRQGAKVIDCLGRAIKASRAAKDQSIHAGRASTDTEHIHVLLDILNK